MRNPHEPFHYDPNVCGRFTHKYTWKQIHDLLDLRWPPAIEIPPSFNVAPSQNAPIVRMRDDGRELVMARWGLVPAWSRDESGSPRPINARAETASSGPLFRAAFVRRRCIVPVSGFYEWQKTGGKAKQPWYIYRADGQPMLLAGLWESAPAGEGGAALETFTILTTPANSAVAHLHDRMPAVLEPERVGAWLGSETTKEHARAMLAPAADGILAMHPVSTAVNSPRNNGPQLAEHAGHSTLENQKRTDSASRTPGLFDVA